MTRKSSTLQGLLALSPLVVFLLLYQIPVSAAFLIASVWAVIVSKGKNIDEKLEVFARGAGEKNVLLMIWIFILAGAFAQTAKDIGAVDATVNLALRIIPGWGMYAGLFITACFISMAIGTSVGTIVALVPLASGIAQDMGVNTAFMAAIVVGGAFFGDNLSFISDTTIASTKAAGCSMRDKFKANFAIVAPAMLIVTAIYLFQGLGSDMTCSAGESEWYKILPYILILVLAMAGVNVATVLAIGTAVCGITGALCGDFGWRGFLASMGRGITGMGDLITVTLLAGGMMETIRWNGGMDLIIDQLEKFARGKRGAELSIAALVSIANLCTANNTIAILSTGKIASGIAARFGIDPRKTASLLDTFSCLVQGLIPYGAQLLMASTLCGRAGVEIIRYLYYPVIMGAVAVAGILLRYPKKYS